MSIYRGTGGSGNSTDDSIVSAVTEQAGIATTKAGEAATSASNANTSATNAATSATTASTKATEAASSATTASTKATEANTAKTGAETAKTAAEAARDTALVHANTANNTHVQTVSGIATEVQNLDSIKTDITGVNTIKSDVTTVAGISSNVTTVAADASDIGTVATNITNVNNVGDNIANVNSVAGNATNINTVAGDASDIGTVSSNISNVNTVAGISSDVTTVAGLESKMDTVIADASDIGAVANNIDDVTTVAGINSEVDTVAGISAKVTTVADNITDVQNADTNAANASASASQAANSATAASNSATTASTKATESHASALAASNSASTATTKATEAAGSATTATTKATEASTSATNAATSATTATTKASEALNSANTANSSATTATTKASEADVSANSAATSATDASNAASTWTNYYSTYLGAADAPPTADVQGNALQTGAFYYDTGAGSNTVGLYVYNGSSWVYSTNYNNVTAPYSLAQDLATNGNDISFGDNAKAKFGASDDLQIYHDGTNSYVKDTGTGYLILGNSDAGTIIKNGSGQNLLTTTASEIRLGHQGNTKLATKSTGIDVTGTVTADGLDITGSVGGGDVNSQIKNASNDANSTATLNLRTNNGAWDLQANRSGYFDINTPQDRLALRIGSSTNDISFYEDTGTTPKFFWDASAERLGIGTTNPQSLLDLGVNNTAGDGLSFGSVNSELRRGNSGTNVQLSHWGNLSMVIDSDGNDTARYFNVMHNTNESSTATELFRVQENGKVGIGTTSPSSIVHASGVGATFTLQDTRGTGNTHTIRSTGTNGESLQLDSAQDIYINADTQIFRSASEVERMRIDSSGNVGIGTSSPATALDVNSGTINKAATFKSTDATTFIQIEDSNTTSAVHGYGVNGNNLSLYANGSERMRITSSGRVGIGRTPTSHILETQGEIKLVSLGASEGIDAFNTNSVQWGIKSASATAGGVTFEVGNSEKMRIDASGNVLVGKTSSGSTIEGAELHNSGAIFAVRDSNPAGAFDRKTTDGDVVQFRKDGTIVGSIGTTGGDMYVGTGDTGIRFDDATNHIRPCGVNGANLDAAIDIGDSTRRFKDLYLSGGIKGSTLTFSGNGSSEHARIDSSGNVLVGKTSAVYNTAGTHLAPDGQVFITGGNQYGLAVNRTTGDGDLVLFSKDGTTVGSISVTSSATAYNTSSDERLKENIQDAEDAGSKIDAIQIRQFDWKSDGSHQDYGVIAQELLEVAPEAVTEGETEDDMMSVDYSKLVPTLIKEIQTLRNRVAQLENN